WEGGRWKVNAGGHRNAQIARDKDQFCVARIISSATCHPVPGLKLIGVTYGFNNHTGGAVTKRLWLIQARHHFLVCGNHSLPFYILQHLSHQIRPTASLTQQAALSRTNRSPFGPGTNQRVHIPNQNARRRNGGGRNFFYFKLTGSEILDKLFHTGLNILLGALARV